MTRVVLDVLPTPKDGVYRHQKRIDQTFTDDWEGLDVYRHQKRTDPHGDQHDTYWYRKDDIYMCQDRANHLSGTTLGESSFPFTDG